MENVGEKIRKRGGKRLPWWARPIDEKRLGIFGTRFGASLAIAAIIGIISTPWLLFVMLGLLASGALFAIALHSSNWQPPLSINEPRGGIKTIRF